jgi:hypothetical protein
VASPIDLKNCTIRVGDEVELMRGVFQGDKEPLIATAKPTSYWEAIDNLIRAERELTYKTYHCGLVSTMPDVRKDNTTMKCISCGEVKEGPCWCAYSVVWNGHPVDNIKGQVHVRPADNEMIESVKRHGILSPILVDSQGYVIDGRRRLRAAQSLGMVSVPIRTYYGDKSVYKHVKGHPMAYKHPQICRNEHCVATKTSSDYCEKHALSATKCSRQDVGCSQPLKFGDSSFCVQHREEYNWTAAKAISEKKLAEKREFRIKQEAMQHFKSLSESQLRAPEQEAAAFAKAAQMGQTETVAKRINPKIRCLEPACKKLISIKNNEDANRHFCKAHHKANRGYEDFPKLDRDGDPIWIQKGFNVIKIKDMEDSHLTNTLVFLETNAKKRCEITGLPADKWKLKATPRYDELLWEAKKRDEKLLKCDCTEGLRCDWIESSKDEDPIPVTIICDKCSKGKQRQAAKEAAEQLAAQKGKMTLKVATVMIISLMAGGVFQGGAEFVQYVIAHLHLMGAIK